MEAKDAPLTDLCARDMEAYARTVFHQKKCNEVRREADTQLSIATSARQSAWALVQAHIESGRITPGIYVLRGGHALTIEPDHHFPDVKPLRSLSI